MKRLKRNYRAPPVFWPAWEWIRWPERLEAASLVDRWNWQPRSL